jgi:hypothetical protein
MAPIAWAASAVGTSRIRFGGLATADGPPTVEVLEEFDAYMRGPVDGVLDLF